MIYSPHTYTWEFNQLTLFGFDHRATYFVWKEFCTLYTAVSQSSLKFDEYPMLQGRLQNSVRHSHSVGFIQLGNCAAQNPIDKERENQNCSL